jgi:hypothetical protein
LAGSLTQPGHVAQNEHERCPRYMPSADTHFKARRPIAAAGSVAARFDRVRRPHMLHLAVTPPRASVLMPPWSGSQITTHSCCSPEISGRIQVNPGLAGCEPSRECEPSHASGSPPYLRALSRPRCWLHLQRICSQGPLILECLRHHRPKPALSRHLVFAYGRSAGHYKNKPETKSGADRPSRLDGQAP